MLAPGSYIKDLLTSEPGRAVTARGWVKTHRSGKGIDFIQINDGSCFADLQIVVADEAVAQDILDLVTTGSCISATGELVASPAKGQSVELKATAIEVHGTADPADYPLQKKGASMEFLRTIAHLRPRSNTFGAVFRVRNSASYAIHRFFQERGFQWLHTPIITASDASSTSFGCSDESEWTWFGNAFFNHALRYC